MAGAKSRVSPVREALLAWYREHGRDLPWRRTRDPYAILVSEVMLQQTQAARVVPRYLAWLERWPTVEALAAASTADVIRAWQGLGYNRRALNLQRAARQIARDGWPGRPDACSRASARTRLPRSPASRSAEPVLPDGCERAPRPRAHRARVRPHLRAGADGPRRDDLHRTGAPLRRVSSGRRNALRAGAVSSRSASKARSRARSGSGGHGRCGSSPSPRARSPSSTSRRSSRWSATSSSWSRTSSCACLPSA